MSTKIRSGKEAMNHPYRKEKRKVADAIYTITENREIKLDMPLSCPKIHYIAVGGAKVRIKEGDKTKTMGFMTVPSNHLISILIHLKLNYDSSNPLGNPD